MKSSMSWDADFRAAFLLSISFARAAISSVASGSKPGCQPFEPLTGMINRIVFCGSDSNLKARVRIGYAIFFLRHSAQDGQTNSQETVSYKIPLIITSSLRRNYILLKSAPPGMQTIQVIVSFVHRLHRKNERLNILLSPPAGQSHAENQVVMVGFSPRAV